LIKGSWGLAHPMNLTELAILDARRPLSLGDITSTLCACVCLSECCMIL
jgi:hypothetical protein